MNTNYTLDAFTLIADPTTMVLLMDAKKAGGKHVTYQNYVDKTGLDDAEDPIFSKG